MWHDPASGRLRTRYVQDAATRAEGSIVGVSHAQQFNPLKTNGKRVVVLGGGFGEPGYMFIDADSQSPWQRRPNFGLRCVKLPASPPASAASRTYLSSPILKMGL